MLSGLTALFPGALALAALVPLIWWLHRARSRGEPLEVSSLWLFRKKEAASPALIEPRRDKRADPAWIRRALLVLALAGALAGLGRLTRTPTVTVWIDGSVSLKTREQGETRLQAALAQLNRRLAARRIGKVTLRSLARPDFTLRLRVPFDARRVAKEIPIGAPGSTSASPLWPEPSTLDPAAEQWLVTDGADPALLRWLSAAPIAHLVQAGTLTENTALTLIAYRPTLAGNGCGDLIVTVYNAGLATSHRRLDVTAPPCPASPAAARPSATELTLPAGATRTLHFTVGSPPFRIEARLAPADALPDDDALALDLARPLAARVAFDPACRRALAAAEAAHPAVVSAPPTTAHQLDEST